MTAPRTIRVLFQKEWLAAERRGLLAPDPRVRTLCRVLVTYPEVRHIVPDRISLEGSAESRTLETIVRFLERQAWLVKSVVLE
ncbi:MAG: hypothetical protein DMD78_10095 [Candidatus Rokuibacteriota bacterium]|nr:MAG: hypothetical protein DMD78_10095 [Candidatus Rokubacteria bacterium]